MSTGPRIPYTRAKAAAELLLALWRMPPAACQIVGSIRRRRAEVGDIEILVPQYPKKGDSVYDRILPTIDGAERPLFTDGVGQQTPTFARAIKGFKPGFLQASLEVQMRIAPAATDGDSGRCIIPVQVFRYTPENAGWQLIMRTGPTDFGKWFLWKWKIAWRTGPEGKGSIDGHLVDNFGKVVPVETEAKAFSLARVPITAPEHRDEFMQRIGADEAASWRMPD